MMRDRRFLHSPLLPHVMHLPGAYAIGPHACERFLQMGERGLFSPSHETCSRENILPPLIEDFPVTSLASPNRPSQIRSR